MVCKHYSLNQCVDIHEYSRNVQHSCAFGTQRGKRYEENKMLMKQFGDSFKTVFS